MAKKRLAVYVRTPRNFDSDREVEYFKKPISQRKDCELVEIYFDKGASGMDRNRPMFKKMIEDAKAKKFDYIICRSIDRFSRDAELAFSTIAEIHKSGVEVLFESEDYRPTTEILIRASGLAKTLQEKEKELAEQHPEWLEDDFEEPDEPDEFN